MIKLIEAGDSVTFDIESPLFTAIELSGYGDVSDIDILDSYEAPKEWRKTNGMVVPKAKSIVLDNKLSRVTAICREAYDWATFQDVSQSYAAMFLPMTVFVSYRWISTPDNIRHMKHAYTEKMIDLIGDDYDDE